MIGVPCNEAHTSEGLRSNVDRAERLKAIATRFDITLPQLAIAVDVELDNETLAEIRNIAFA